MIFDLPDLLLEMIQSFLTPRSIYTVHTMKSEWNLFEERFQGDKSWRNLMNTTKRVHKHKTGTIYLILKSSFALLYMNDEIFRQRVDGLLQNRREQLHISFQQSTLMPLILRNISWDGCNKVSLYNLEIPVELSTISNVNGTIYKVNIEMLALDSCPTIEMIGNCPKLTRLSVEFCFNLRDISNLSNLISLYVYYCPALTVQEETLQTVQLLWLGDQTTIFPSHNINSFKNLKELCIMDKKVVLDEFWQLDNLLSLTFEACEKVEVTKFPKNLKTLMFEGSNVKPLSAITEMPNLISITFSGRRTTQQVIDLPKPLKSVRFNDCFSLTDIYLNSAVNELIMSDYRWKPSYTFREDSPKITLWLGQGIPMPRLRLRALVKVVLEENILNHTNISERK